MTTTEPAAPPGLELFRWLPDLRATSEPDHLQSSFIHGIKRTRCEFTPARIDPLED